MAVVAILGSVAAAVVAVITVWNTTTVSGQRLRVQRAVRVRRERKELARQIASFAAEPALVEFEDRLDELVDAYAAKQIPHDLAALWSQVFRLAGASPVGRPFQYGVLVVHRDMNAMTIRRGSDSMTGLDWLDPYRIPPPPLSAVKPSASPIPVIKA